MRMEARLDACDGKPIRTLSSSRRTPGPITTDVSRWMELRPQLCKILASVVMGSGSRFACPGRRKTVIASEAKQSISPRKKDGLLRFARNDGLPSSRTSEARSGTHNHRCQYFAKLGPQFHPT